MRPRLNGKVALVVGAKDEVGQAISSRLSSLGAIVVAADPIDASKAAATVERLVWNHERLDILVNNTPDPAGRPASTLSASDLVTVMADTAGAQYAYIREALPYMRRQKSGRIVNLSSIRYLGLPGGVDTAAAQSALLGLTRSIALEAAADGVTVNTLVKGEFSRPGESDEASAARTNGVPVKRLGVANDAVHAAIFFASDASKYVTGQTFFVCGGKSAYFSMSV
jgi:NAD(P)-dependent dehydrogenase (short-subunit alcohol dehydrogenase family)